MPDMTKVNKWLNYICKIWANNNEECYQYLLSWLYSLLVNVGKKPGVAVFAYSPEQGVGKNTFTDFLGTYVIGDGTSCDVSGFEPILQKHNGILQAKRLVIINEAAKIGKELT